MRVQTLNRRKVRASYAIVLLLSAFLLYPPSLLAGEICFSEETAGGMVVELERNALLKEQLILQEQMTKEISQQVDSLKEIVRLQKEQLEVSNNMIESQKKLAEAQDANCRQMIKAAKPTFLDNVKSNVLAGGVGAVLAVVAILLL